MPRARRSTALVLSLLVAGGLGACSNEPENPFPGNDTMPGNTGSTCADRTGDLSKDPKSLGGNLNAPAGADIVEAEARLDQSRLKVSMTMAAPIIGTPNPDFVLAQGLPSEDGSFELHAEPTDPTAQTWRLRLVRYAKDAQGLVQEVRPPTVLTTPVTVDGATISYDVAQSDIPRVASYVWQFGTSAEDASGVTVLDVCDGADAPESPSSSAPGTTAPPRKLEGKVGDTELLTHSTGARVAVLEVQSPPTDPAAGATPPDAGTKLALVEVRLCAPADRTLATGSRFFYLQDSEDRVVTPKAVATPAKPSALGAELTLSADACDRSWVTFQIDQSASPKTVIYTTDPTDRTGLTALQFRVG